METVPIVLQQCVCNFCPGIYSITSITCTMQPSLYKCAHLKDVMVVHCVTEFQLFYTLSTRFNSSIDKKEGGVVVQLYIQPRHQCLHYYTHDPLSDIAYLVIGHSI